MVNKRQMNGWWFRGQNLKDLSTKDRFIRLLEIMRIEARRVRLPKEREKFQRWAERRIVAAREGQIPEEKMKEDADKTLAFEIIGERQHLISRWMSLARAGVTLAVISLIIVLSASSQWWVIFGTVIFIASVISSICFRRRLKRLRVIYREQLPFDSLSPDLLLLRSFRDDTWRYNVFPFGLLENFLFDFEETLLEDALPRGLAVALGGEGSARSGIVRIVLPRSDWQMAVTSLVVRSEFVLIFPHFTEGLAWEIEFMLNPTNRSKLLVLIPAKGFLDIATRWSKFICLMKRCGIPLEPPGGWGDDVLYEQARLFFPKRMRRMWEAILYFHPQHGGDDSTLVFLLQCLSRRAVGCVFDQEGKPVLFSSTPSGHLLGGMWRPVPHTYGAVLKMMMDYVGSNGADRSQYP